MKYKVTVYLKDKTSITQTNSRDYKDLITKVINEYYENKNWKSYFLKTHSTIVITDETSRTIIPIENINFVRFEEIS